MEKIYKSKESNEVKLFCEEKMVKFKKTPLIASLFVLKNKNKKEILKFRDIDLKTSAFSLQIRDLKNRIDCYDDFFVLSTKLLNFTISERDLHSYFKVYDYEGNLLHSDNTHCWDEEKDYKEILEYLNEGNQESHI